MLPSVVLIIRRLSDISVVYRDCRVCRHIIIIDILLCDCIVDGDRRSLRMNGLFPSQSPAALAYDLSTDKHHCVE